MSFIDDFNHLKLKLKDIKLATNDFSDNPIGTGGFGKVFKGELSLPDGGKKMVAFKRLDRKYGQGDVEFCKEVMVLSQYKHENLISLVGYCNDDGERILAYEYASGGSLDSYLGKSRLTWNQLLKICHGAACGLNHLHDPMGMHQRLLHRDVKSSNILLDENLTAKISDFGLSKVGPANQQYTYCIVSNIAGTPGYCDPVYLETGTLSKESDVYSFGVVLFEVMCGRLCTEYCNGEQRIKVPLWKKCCEENILDDIVCKNLREQIDIDSLKTFSSIAYQCLHRNRKERPTMAEIIKKLEIALDHQEMSQDANERAKFEERIKMAKEFATPISCISRNELALVLSQGIPLKDGYSWLSLNKNGEYSEMIHGRQCLPSDVQIYYGSQELKAIETGLFTRDADFPCLYLNSDFRLQASSRFLSPHVKYSVNLVYKYWFTDKGEHVPLKYKLEKNTKYWTSCVAQRRGEWLSTKLFHFTSSKRKHEFAIHFSGQLRPIFSKLYKHSLEYYKYFGGPKRWVLHLIGIEFLPVEYEDKNKVDMPPIQESDTDLERRLPSDYAEIIKLSESDLHWTTNSELYSLLRNGFLINNNEQWFSISKNMKKRHMLSAVAVLQKGSIWNSLPGMKQWMWKPPPDSSRFKLVAESCKIKSFTIVTTIQSQLLSLETSYACYLVYKLPTKHTMVNGLVKIDDETRPEDCPADWRDDWQYDKRQLVDLLAPTQIPFIGGKADESHSTPSRTLKIKGHPKLRKDGWMEIQIWDFKTGATHEPILMHCRVKSYDNKQNFTGLLVQGIEFRPAKVCFARP